MYSMSSRDSILEPWDCGLANGHLTLTATMYDVAEVRGLFAPPYFSGDFRLVLRFNELAVRASGSQWRPDRLTRTGKTKDGLRIATELIPAAWKRAFLLRIELKNPGVRTEKIQVHYEIHGGAGKTHAWNFGYPSPTPRGVPARKGSIYSILGNDAMVSVDTSLSLVPSPLNVNTGVLEAETLEIPARGKVVFHIFVSLGAPRETAEDIAAMKADPEKVRTDAEADWNGRIRNLFKHLPNLESDNKALVKYYRRSLLHLLMNEWRVPEFKLNPHYSTGSIRGSCICAYLWNYGGPYRLWSLFSPRSAREHIRAFLSLDLSACYAFSPFDCSPVGPYYPVNQEKIIFLTHAYVTQTGDIAFLKEKLNGKTILEHILAQTLLHDDPSRPAVLADYGKKNDHLELRNPNFATDTALHYEGVLPDLNLRRCVNFHLAAELFELASVNPGIDLTARARALKELIHKKLFSRKEGWFANIDPEGRRIFRYTIQMFKALGWNDWALTPESEAALLKHLMDENEFVGKFGLHSLSKLDPAYDTEDADNGGPGACVSFPPAIIDRLYRSGHIREAETLLRRLFWIADALPYWGDSTRADVRDYRHDSPLLCNNEGAVAAQTVLFGMFGIHVRKDFSIEIAPHPPEGTRLLHLRNMRLAGMKFDIKCGGTPGLIVTVGKKKFTASAGGSVILPAVL